MDYNQEYNSEYDDDYKEEEDYDDNSSSNNNPFQHYKVESKYFEKAVTNSDDMITIMIIWKILLH